MDRKSFIKKSALATLGLSALTGAYAWQIEPFWLEFVNVDMPIKNLPKHLEGKTLMQISDVHVGNRFDYNYIIESFQEAQKLQPDIVVYTGDYVNYESSEQIKQLNTVFKHAVKGTLGTLGILGNHDYGKDWKEQHVADAITNVLQQSGVNVLKNEITDLNGLQVIGLDDYWGLNFDPLQVLTQENCKKGHVVLCHNPDVCDLFIWQDFNNWILSGHTHGGQCKPPFLRAPLLPVENKRYTQGEIALSNQRTLYINRALGHLWQVRFNVRPEITVFKLKQAEV